MRTVAIGVCCALLLVLAPDTAWARARVDDPSQRAGHEVGRLRIPAIGVEEVVREGVAQAVIDRGVAHWVGTAAPGEGGNLVLAGHRSTFSRPFEDLDLLRPGDLVYVAWLEGPQFVYRVTETLVVTPYDVWVVDRTPVAMLTLFTCHPKGSARQRLVVRAELVGPFAPRASSTLAWVV